MSLNPNGNHGRVRAVSDDTGLQFAVTLDDVEHKLSLDEVCGLVNALSYTMVDGQEHWMQTTSRETPDGPKPTVSLGVWT